MVPTRSVDLAEIVKADDGAAELSSRCMFLSSSWRAARQHGSQRSGRRCCRTPARQRRRLALLHFETADRLRLDDDIAQLRAHLRMRHGTSTRVPRQARATRSSPDSRSCRSWTARAGGRRSAGSGRCRRGHGRHSLCVARRWDASPDGLSCTLKRCTPSNTGKVRLQFLRIEHLAVSGDRHHQGADRVDHVAPGCSRTGTRSGRCS